MKFKIYNTELVVIYNTMFLKITSQKNLVKREILYIFFYKWKKISIDQITNQINNQNNKLLITKLSGR